MFRVIWMAEALRSIESALARADAESKEIIETDIVRTRALLEHDPANFGESREADIRVGFVGACGVRYRIDDQNAFVRVLEFWLTSRA